MKSSPVDKQHFGTLVFAKILAKITIAGILVVLLATFSTAAAAQRGSEESRNAVAVQMRNIKYHFSDQISVHIRTLTGQLVPAKGDLPIFDDKESFKIRINSAEIAITPASLANVLNSYVFSKSDAPLKDVSIAIENQKLKLKGKLHRKGDIPFESTGTLSSSENGRIRLHLESLKALHLPVKGLMELLGIDVADVIKTGKVPGLSAQEDDLILDPATLLPAPHIIGQVTAVGLEHDSIVQVFGHPSTFIARVPDQNYMAYRGNRLRFGKLTMSDTDMVLIDMDPSDPFDFYLDHYIEQLVAGYTKETPSFGLRVFMRDYDKLPQARRHRATTAR